MLHVEVVDLSPRGVTLPGDRVGMVIAQPFVSLSESEPYRCTPESKPHQMHVLEETLRIARTASHGAEKTHFTVFPEYCVPGIEGVNFVTDAVRADAWPPGTIVIGGSDALSREELLNLASEPSTHFDVERNGADHIAATEWINCEVIWVKAADGNVERYLQPKLRPAGPQRDVQYQRMFRGNSVYAFKGPFNNGTQYHFSSLVCFDWVASIDMQPAWRCVLERLRDQVAPGELSLSWFFVIQSNKKPSHDTFLSGVHGFFDQTIAANVRRDRTCLVFANTAGKAVPGRALAFGSTSLIFSRQTQFGEPHCQLTCSNGGPRYRASTLLSAYRDVFFRERGACVHSFAQVNPDSLPAGPVGKVFPVDNTSVFPLYGKADPRARSAPVPGCLKWLNDELDDIPPLSSSYPSLPLAGPSATVHAATVAALREISPQSAAHVIKLSTQGSSAQHADEWDQLERHALEHLVHTLDILSLGITPQDIGVDRAHAKLSTDNGLIDLLAIRGDTHEDCLKHCRDHYLPPQRRQVLLISRDRDNNPVRRRSANFLQTERPVLGQERKITDPAGGLLHLGYRELLNMFQDSTTPIAIQGAIGAELSAT